MNALVDSYSRDGFFLPFRAISAETARQLRNDYESAEKELAGSRDRLTVLRQYPHRPHTENLRRDMVVRVVPVVVRAQEQLVAEMSEIRVQDPGARRDGAREDRDAGRV